MALAEWTEEATSLKLAQTHTLPTTYPSGRTPLISRCHLSKPINIHTIQNLSQEPLIPVAAALAEEAGNGEREFLVFEVVAEHHGSFMP
jgi:hypothetical protein